MDKYYTPDISEFYVGFEVECYNSAYKKYNEPEWIKIILNEGNDFESLEEGLLKKHLRVKYLDKKDIKELGFEQGKLPYQFFDGIHKLVYLENNKTSIIHIADDCFLFYGVIKNKSELRKLLIQLGIS